MCHFAEDDLANPKQRKNKKSFNKLFDYLHLCFDDLSAHHLYNSLAPSVVVSSVEVSGNVIGWNCCCWQHDVDLLYP